MTATKINSKVSVTAEKAQNGRYRYVIVTRSGKRGVPASYDLGKAIYTRPWTARRGGIRAYNAE